MVFKRISWTGVIICLVLYYLVFMAVGYERNVDSLHQARPQLGLLMFAIPGAIAALTSREAPLTVALLGALLATPFILLTLCVTQNAQYVSLQEVAFITSALFWCGSGALALMLSRSLLGHEKHS